MKPTIEQVRNALECAARSIYEGPRWNELAASLDGMVLIPVSDCPNCDNGGRYFVRRGEGEDPELEQCQFCYEVANSRFNLTRALEEANAND